MDGEGKTAQVRTTEFSEAFVHQLHRQYADTLSAHADVRVNIAHFAQQLTNPRARTFANEGIGRRLQVIQRTVFNTFSTYPPGRADLLTNDEGTDVAIQFHAFVLSLTGLFDNIAWICMLEAGGDLPPTQVGLYRRECRAFLPPRLLAYIHSAESTRWRDLYGKPYRDSIAHRIAPYLPPRIFLADDATRYEYLDAQSAELLFREWTDDTRHEQMASLDRYHDIEREKGQLGMNSAWLALSATGEKDAPFIYLHPQMLSDWALAHELVTNFVDATRDQYGWRSFNKAAQ